MTILSSAVNCVEKKVIDQDGCNGLFFPLASMHSLSDSVSWASRVDEVNARFTWGLRERGRERERGGQRAKERNRERNKNVDQSLWFKRRASSIGNFDLITSSQNLYLLPRNHLKWSTISNM